MNQRRIVIDGKTYNSVEEMPAEVRQNYEAAMRSLDANQNGAATAFQSVTTNMTNAAKIIVNGQVYDGLDQLPPEVRAKYEQAMGAMDANRNGVPDFLEGMLNLPNQPTNQTPVSFGTPTPTPAPAARQPLPVNATIEPESSGNWLLILTGVVLIGLCVVAAGAAVWYFYLR